MSKRTTFTNISPLPASMTREQALGFLHDHMEMIDLNPLVIERHRIDVPPHALEGEQHCTWYSITDKIEYLPGGAVKGDVSYTCAFHDMPDGLQTHCYAPMGTDIRDRWTVAGTLPGEPPQPVELGIGAPKQGLYLREDVELRCNFLMSSFVKKTLSKSHGKLVDTMVDKARRLSRQPPPDTTTTAGSTPSMHPSQPYAPSISSLSSGANGFYTPPTLGGRPSSQGQQHPQASGQPSAYAGHVMENPSRPSPPPQQQYPYQQPQSLAPAPNHHQAPSPITPYGDTQSGWNNNTNGHYSTHSSSYQSTNGGSANPWPAPLGVNKPLPPSPANGQGIHHRPTLSELGGGGNYTTSGGGHVAELGGDRGRTSYSQQHMAPQELPTEYNTDWRATQNRQALNGGAHRPAELA